MALQRLKQLDGKTIETAQLSWAEYGDGANMGISLTFTDGTEFSLDSKAVIENEAVMFTKRGARKVLQLEVDDGTT